MSFPRHLVKMGLLCAVLTVLIDPIWGSYEGFFSMLISGNLNDVPMTRAYIYGGEPLARVAASFHQLDRVFPWVGLAVGLNYLVSMALVSRLLDRLVVAKGNSAGITMKLLILPVLTSSAFVLPEYSYSSVGFLSAAVAILSIWQLCHFSKRGFGFWGKVILLTMFFLNAFAFRIDSAMGGTFIALAVIAASGVGVWRTALVLAIPGVLSLSMVMWVYGSFTELDFLRRVEPYVYYVTDSRHQPAVEMKDGKDSIMVQAAQWSFVNDTSMLNVAFFERLSDQKNKAINRADKRMAVFMDAASNTVIPAVRANLSISVVYLIMALMSVIAYIGRGSPFSVLRPLVFHTTMVTTILTIGAVLKMETWHYVPMMQLIILGSMTLIAVRWPDCRPWLRNALAVIYPVCIVITLGHLATASLQNREIAEQRLETLQLVQTYRGERMLYLDGSSREILNGHVYRPYVPLQGILLYDQGQLAMIPGPKAVLDDLCQCNSGNFPDFVDFLVRKSEDVVILSSEQRLHLISEYARILYDKNVRFISCGDFSPYQTQLSEIGCYKTIGND